MDERLVILAPVVAAAVVIILGLLCLRRIFRSLPRESSREQWLRWRGCERKRAYSSKQDAQVVVKRHQREGDVVEAYQCRFCGRWHVGHPAPLRRSRS